MTDEDGQFSLSSVPSGPFSLVVSSPGFAPQIIAGLLGPSAVVRLPPIRLTLAFDTVSIEVTPTSVIADRQIREAEKQRLLGVVPNTSWSACQPRPH